MTRVWKAKGTGNAWRSKFENAVGAVLPPGALYEAKKFTFPLANPLYRCGACGTKGAVRNSTYMPDFLLPNGTYIEAKGKLDGLGRKRLIAWRAAHPDVVLRIVFMADNKLSKTSKTRYSDWATKSGFEFCVGISNIPKGWFNK